MVIPKSEHNMNLRQRTLSGSMAILLMLAIDKKKQYASKAIGLCNQL